MKHAPLSAPNVVPDKTGVHVTGRQHTIAASRRNVTSISQSLLVAGGGLR
ncbi:hypothetical protein [Mesorhizobium argentiipisi]|uniref:Uncharacterized protein n=1 Tax=Mesorhizobium argentiipisi TaxID=3015175 RepID=A0ABU8KKI6_9HYPH